MKFSILPMRRLSAAIVASVLALLAVLVGATPANALVGVWYNLPVYNTATPKIQITSWTAASADTRISWRGYIYNPSGSYMYLEHKRVGGVWGRATVNVAPRTWRNDLYGSKQTYFYSTSWSFRLCKVVNNYPDTCGSAATINRDS